MSTEGTRRLLRVAGQVGVGTSMALLFGVWGASSANAMQSATATEDGGGATTSPPPDQNSGDHEAISMGWAAEHAARLRRCRSTRLRLCRRTLGGRVGTKSGSFVSRNVHVLNSAIRADTVLRP